MVGEACLIPQNVLVRMNQEGLFGQDEDENGQVIDLMSDLNNEEKTFSEKRRTEADE